LRRIKQEKQKNPGDGEQGWGNGSGIGLGSRGLPVTEGTIVAFRRVIMMMEADGNQDGG
jgi:hypothetical protein